MDFGQGSLKGLSLGGGVNYQSRTYAGTTGTNLLRTQYPYAVTSLSADYRVNRNVTVSALVDNVFDVTYYTRLGGTNTYNSYGRPRSFTLSLRLTRCPLLAGGWLCPLPPPFKELFPCALPL